ncbi:MAG: Ig-like domain-containing protein [bacterium]|nr:Ig-like domain-containing protein [bacterium]
MKRIIIPAVLALLFVSVAVARALAPPEVRVELAPLTNATVFGGQLDVLGLDMTVIPGKDDVLDVLFVKQDGTAEWERDIVAAELWADAGAIGFQGIGVDTLLGAGTWLGSENGWAFRRINADVPAAGRRFFITVDVLPLPTNHATTRLTLQTHLDRFKAMEYDAGDHGIFLRTARPAPVAVMTSATLTIQQIQADTLAPTVRITEPVDGSTFARDWIFVRGVAQDHGGSAVAKVQLAVNRVGKAQTWIDAVPEIPGFGTWEVRLFGLPRGNTIELRVRGEDWNGNRSTLGAPVLITLTE